MKQISTRTLALIALFAVAVLAVGFLVFQNQKSTGDTTKKEESSEYPSEYARLLAEMEAERESRNKTPEEREAYAKMIEEERKKEQEAIQALYTNTDEKLKTGELVWYDIPELGVRFKVSPEVKEELVYKNVTLSRGLEEEESGKTALVSFSTKTLESISESCSAEDGPVGVISRRVGSPVDPVAPCGGGYKMKEIPNGYFCYGQAQAPCLSREQEEQNENVLSNTPGSLLLMSEQFWNEAEVIE